MIDLKQAIAAARDALGELYDENERADLLLEEVQPPSEGQQWQITFSFVRPVSTTDPFRAVARRPRIYKSVKINAENGAFEGMTIREIRDI